MIKNNSQANRIRRILIPLSAIIMIMCGIIFFTTNNTYAAMNEAEENNSIVTANTIELNENIKGTSDYLNSWEWYSGKGDWFKFKAPVSGIARIFAHIGHGPTDTVSEVFGGNTMMFTVENQNGNDLAYLEVNGSDLSGKKDDFKVTCGKTYYINVQEMLGGEAPYRFKIVYNIGKTSIKSASGKNNAFEIKWNKKSNAAFYQIQYTKKSVYSSYSWTKAKKINVSAKKNSKTIKKLANKKKYCVRVRVARTINGKTYFSPWSKRKTVKTK